MPTEVTFDAPLQRVYVQGKGQFFKLTCIPTTLPLLKKSTLPMPGDVIERSNQRWEVLKVTGYKPAKNRDNE